MKASDSETVINLSQHNFIPRLLSTTCPEVPQKHSRSSVQALINLVGFSPQPLLISVSFVCFSFFCFCLFFGFLFVCLFVHYSFAVFHFSFSNSVRHHQSNFLGCSDRVFPSLSPDSFVANSCIPDVLRSNASLEPNWWPLAHALNSESQSDPTSVTVQERGNASPAMKKVLPGTTTKDRLVREQARVSICVNSESVLNEIDESDLQSEKHDEQRI
jgi:hypothetical protein